MQCDGRLLDRKAEVVSISLTDADRMARILLAEDDSLLRETLRVALQGAGHEVLAAPNGSVAINLAREKDFDLIVTDVLMPEMDGLELIQGLRKARSDVPIIAMSGGGSMDMLEYARHSALSEC